MQHATLHFIFGPVTIPLFYSLFSRLAEKYFESRCTGCQTVAELFKKSDPQFNCLSSFRLVKLKNTHTQHIKNKC